MLFGSFLADSAVESNKKCCVKITAKKTIFFAFSLKSPFCVSKVLTSKYKKISQVEVG
jgi:hypothetical protein